MAQLLPYLKILQRGWWIIVLTALAAFNLALFNAYNTTPLYRARAQFLVSPGPTLLAGAEDDLVRGIEALDKRSIVSTYAEILGSKSIYDSTVATLQIDPETLSDYQRTAIVLPDASVLELTIDGPNPEMAALLANQVGERAINHIKGLYLIYEINLLDPATPPSEPYSPVPIRDAAIALFLGGMAGLFLVVLREFLTSPLSLFRQRIVTDPHSSAFTNRYMRQLIEQTVHTSEMTALALLQIANLSELKEQIPKPIWRQLLKEITGLLRNELRGKDKVGHWGDSTFAILLPEVSGETAVTHLTAIHTQLLNPIILPQFGEPIPLETHIGVTVMQSKQSADSLIKAAERALAQSIDKTPPIALFKDTQKTSTPSVVTPADVTYSVAKTG